MDPDKQYIEDNPGAHALDQMNNAGIQAMNEVREEATALLTIQMHRCAMEGTFIGYIKASAYAMLIQGLKATEESHG